MPKRFRTEQGFSFTCADNWREVSIETYLEIIDPANIGKGSAWFISLLSGVPIATLRKQRTGFDFNEFVLTNLPFRNDPPQLWDIAPEQLSFNGRVFGVPNDLGSVSSYGQMCDVELFLQSEQQASSIFRDSTEPTPFSPFRITRTMLSVFLWDMFETDEYIDRQTAERRVWEKIRHMNCVDALSLVSFFLTATLQPVSSGQITLVTTQEPKKKSWQQALRRVMSRFKTIIQRWHWPTSLRFRSRK